MRFGLSAALKFAAYMQTMFKDGRLPWRRGRAAALTVVSFPNSGRTWLRVMLDHLWIASKFQHNGSAHGRLLTFDALSLAGPHFTKRRVILLLRDPRDTVVSGYVQVTKRHGWTYDGGIAAFVRDPKHGVEKIIRFNLVWLEQGPRMLGFLPISYEHLRADTLGVLKRIAAFVGLAIPDSELAKAVADNTFEQMQHKERSRYYDWRYTVLASRRTAADDPDRAKVRRGKIGGYLDYLSEDDLRYCDEVLQRYRYFETVDAALGRC
jgi:hypothetical protein